MTCIAPVLRPLGTRARRARITAPTAAIPTAISLICATACADSASKSGSSAVQAKIGDLVALLGRNVRVAEFRWNGEFVLVDIDAAAGDPTALHAQPADCRVGLYGTPAQG